MVNHGSSRGCLTCKTRRVRCDEGRPTCRRCTKSRRTCLGYEGEPNLILGRSTPDFVKTRRAVSAPSGLRRTRPSWHRLDTESDPEVRAALAKFFSDFVLVSKDRSISRGYFDGLQDLLAQADPKSVLVRATTIVALANAASTSSSSDLLYKAQTQYSYTLQAFHGSLDHPVKRNNDEALMTAALLGLYEMIVAAEAYPDVHSTHIIGVSAILCTRDLRIDQPELLPGVRLFRCIRSLLSASRSFEALTPGLPLTQPCPKSDAEPPTQHLDILMLRLRPVLLRATKILSNPKASKVDLSTVKKQASLLNKEFSLWPLCQPKEWAPQTLGIIEKGVQTSDTTFDSMPFWPGKIDSYFDLYVVAVWDTYRKSRLKLLQVITDCSERLRSAGQPQEKPVALQKLRCEMRELVDGLCASIPFHLVADLHHCLQSGGTFDNLSTPGKALGGLLLMYPLYIASTLSLIPSDQRAWMKGRLQWIGKYMGIRQATMLGNVCFFP